MLNKLKSNNYSELTVVNVADRWRERNVMTKTDVVITTIRAIR